MSELSEIEYEWTDAATCLSLGPPEREEGVYGHPIIEDEILGTVDADVFEDHEPILVVIHPMHIIQGGVACFPGPGGTP